MSEESYPGQHTTPEDRRCPVCRGPIDVDQIQLDPSRSIDGRWSCPRGCDPPNAGVMTGPLDRRVVTAREAEEQLGIPASTIRAWASASQQRLFAVSIDEHGRRWYRLADVVELAATTRRRARHARPTRQRQATAA